MEILTKSLLNISESIGIPRNPLLAINQNISNLTYNPLPINSYPSFPPAPHAKERPPKGGLSFVCGACVLFLFRFAKALTPFAWRPSGTA